jgi:alcohol dehydrogenase (cytochrome c)
MLTTAGKLLFTGDLGGNLVAYDPANGKILWHTHLGSVSNAPETYTLDGHQYILVAAGDTLYSFTLY